MKKEWFIAAWRFAVLIVLVWIGQTLNNISSSIYTGPSIYDDHGKAMSKIQESIEELHKTLNEIAKYGAGWRR